MDEEQRERYRARCHVLHQRFGYELLDEPSVIERMLSRTNRGFSDSYTTQLVLREEYQTVYGLYDHDNDESRPLAAVAMLSKESVCTGDPLEEMIRRYRLHRINEKFGLSLTQFLELPRERVQFLFELCAQEATKPDPALDALAKELSKQ